MAERIIKSAGRSGLFIALFLTAACATVPFSGRRQLAFLPEADLVGMSFEAYREMIAEAKLSSDPEVTATLNRVGLRIASAAEDVLREWGQESRIKNFSWEFNLIEDDKTVNAWCTPGGKIAFYTGILPVTRDEAGLAVVMGHEVAHALANHGNERMSQMLLAQLGAVTLTEALKNEKETTQELWSLAFGLGSQLGLLLPYSRAHEYEADRIGLVLMAKAGYDPRSAVGFWSRMMEISGQVSFDFLSTHPATKKRIRDMEKFMPEALQFYSP